MTTLAIVGSRDYSHPADIQEFVDQLLPTTEVLSGAARGVDRWAADYARARGLTVLEIPADWSLGRTAGFLRNSELVRRATHVVAFWNGRSSGTKDTMRKALEAGKLYAVCTRGAEGARTVYRGKALPLLLL